VHGTLRVNLYTAGPSSLLSAPRARVGDREVQLRSARPIADAKVLLVDLEGVTTREAAEALRGEEVALERAAVPLGEGEYLVADLMGCQVVDREGRSLGEVTELFSNGAQDVIVVGDGRMFPLVDEWVWAVDLDARRIVIDPHED
jgi:16S rRNA processing protein RimM